MDQVEIKVEIQDAYGNIVTTLTHPTRSKPIASYARSLEESLTSLEQVLCDQPRDDIKIIVCTADEQIRLWLVDLVMMALTRDKTALPGPLHRWSTLDLRMPADPLPNDRLSAYINHDDAIAPDEFSGRTIVYSGAPENVPSPWFSLGSLTRFGVKNVDIRRTLTPAELTHLAANAYIDKSRDLPLSLRMLGLDGNMDKKDWAASVCNKSLYCRLRALDLGVIGRKTINIGPLVAEWMTQITELELDLTEQQNDTVLSCIRLCTDLKELRVRYRVRQNKPTFWRVCEKLDLVTGDEKKEEGNTVVYVAEKRQRIGPYE